MKRVLPNEHIPYIIVYPRGDLKHKMKNKKVLGANHTIEDLLETVSQMLPDTVESVPNEQLETRIVQSLFDGKLSLYKYFIQGFVP
jgi:hypothetical protein